MAIQFRNSATQYGVGGRVSHWLSVALLVTLILTANNFEELEVSPHKADLIKQHASYGLIFLLVMFSRLIWRCKNDNPVCSYDIQSWQKFSAYFLHRLIYIVLITQSLSGLLNLIYAGFGIPIFGLFEIPALTNKQDDLHQLFTSIHYFLSIVIYPLFAIHVSAAIYHQLFGVLDD